jgi:SAM-dependent methyltransferase
MTPRLQPTQAAGEDYLAVHRRRFELSLACLRPHLRPGLAVLELGGSGPFTDLLRESSGLSAQPTMTDLRYPLPAIADAAFDLVLCMEVLEHLHDQERDLPHRWEGSGAGCMLATAFRVLKPGGLLFLTTPNVCSLRSLAALMALRPPGLYRPHVREYTPAEVGALVRGAGFTGLVCTTCDPWGRGVTGREAGDLLAFLRNSGRPASDRGEDIFLKAFKP